MNYWRIFVLASMSMFCLGNGVLEAKEAQQGLDTPSTTFALNLYQQLKDQHENLFFSPYSISSALAMAYVGSQGKTHQEMQQVLYFPESSQETAQKFALWNERLQLKSSESEPKEVLDLANSLWLQQGIALVPAYQDLMNQQFQAALYLIDFAKNPNKARLTINQWVEDKTQQKIQNLLQESNVTPMTKLILVSAVYFKAPWLEQFNEKSTIDAPFYQQNGQSTTVSMMQLTERFPYYKGDGFALLELPYGSRDTNNRRFSLLIALPDQINGLPDLEKKLTPEALKDWQSHLQQDRVAVSLPKFRVESSFELASTLRGMGMNIPFSSQGDFSGINGKRDLQMDQVIHKTFIDVNEAGTEAAAATAVTFIKSALDRTTPQIFKADHPFFFLIQDKETGLILFMGKIGVVTQ